ncbi:hypothetical protein N7495_006137 [Penicillium taxi]|uniref:uncharacterized protein n=1 Tax=Penicillium taxi TaxID=168475 RepID=UPI00254536B4|nr:uncharacterized protein N7495_006137 [Penicillium taxi]KAJ5894446.1 hypothetical protein N7495_006137 [Penicillium taxi]
MAASKGLESASTAGAAYTNEQQPACSEDKRSSIYPVHPLPQLQDPFEESILETNEALASQWLVNINAQTRRRDLLENDEYERLCGRKWRQRAAEQYHPFWKLISQMAFGVHLLTKRLAKSDARVMRILQTHVDEMDGFIQRTTEDFMIIHLDVSTRIQYLSLPLSNLDLFDDMLQDRHFRLTLISYNDQIEHAIERFTLAITDALKDIRKGKDATSALWHYLHQLDTEGGFDSDILKPFFKVMMDNMEGWIISLSKLRRRGAALQKALSQLSFAVTEMQRRVGVASRKEVYSLANCPLLSTSASFGRPKSVRQRLFSKRPSTPVIKLDKPLPLDPFIGPSTPKSRKAKDTPTTEKRYTKRNSRRVSRLILSKSWGALPAEAIEDATTPPQTPRRISKKLSRPFLLKRAVTENALTPNPRPATAPDRTLKSRSASIEQLKAMWASNRPKTPKFTPKSPVRSEPQRSQQQPDGIDSMKDHISQFLKTDRVIEAWDHMATKTADRKRSSTKLAKDGPCSIFRAKSSDALRARLNDRRGLPGTEFHNQMSWAQQPETWNTYSFKQRPPEDQMTPRIHVLSIQMALDDEMEFGRMSEDNLDVSDDTDSIITALPSLSIASVTAEYRPRMVECA